MPKIENRLGVLHSDGSVTVYAEGWPIDRARAELKCFDQGETNPEKFCKIVEVSLEYTVLGK